MPIVSSESLLLKSSSTIQFLIHNLAIILDETDFLSKAKFLEHLIYNHTIQTESPHKTISDYAKKNNKESSIKKKRIKKYWTPKSQKILKCLDF